jgi:hypothetical protein
MAVVTNDPVHDVQTLRLLRAFLKTDGWEARQVVVMVAEAAASGKLFDEEISGVANLTPKPALGAARLTVGLRHSRFRCDASRPRCTPNLLIQRTTRCGSCELVHICWAWLLLSFDRWGISGAQHVGAAGTRYFEPDGVAFWDSDRPMPQPPAKPLRNHFRKRAKSSGNGAGYSLLSFPGGEIAKMITLKITALVLGAGLLVELFSPPDFSPDLILAIVACFS